MQFIQLLIEIKIEAIKKASQSEAFLVGDTGFEPVTPCL